QKYKGSIDGDHAQKDVITQNKDRQSAEEHRKYDQQQDRQGNAGSSPALWQFADHIQRPDIGCLYDRHQAKDQGRHQPDHQSAKNRYLIESKGNIQPERLLDQVAHQITHANSSSGSQSSAHQTQQACFQAKKQVEIKAAIAGSFEHCNLSFAAREQDLHRIDNTNATDQQRQQTSDLQEFFDIINRILLLAERILCGASRGNGEVRLDLLDRLISLRLVGRCHIDRIKEEGQFGSSRLIIVERDQQYTARLCQHAGIAHNTR